MTAVEKEISLHTNEPVAARLILLPRRRFKALKKSLSFILALLFTLGVVGTSLAQQAAPEEQPAAAAEQAAPKKTTKKCPKKKTAKKHKKSKKCTPAPQSAPAPK